MSETSTTLLVSAACLFGVGLFAVTHRRDALGAVLAVVLGFDAVTCALVGFAGLSANRGEAAQLQSFAILVEVIGVLFAAAGVSMAALLRRRTGGPDLLELVGAGSQPGPGPEPGGDQAESVPEDQEAVESEAGEAALDPAAELGEAG